MTTLLRAGRQLAMLAALFACGHAPAAPYTPANASDVIERLPSRLDPVQRELASMRQQLAWHPGDLPLAGALARRYIELGRSEGDPRYLGYAEAVLKPWWNLPDPPPAARVLRATLRQSTHQFKLALDDLNGLLLHDRRNAQAWLTRATVLAVQGDFVGARASCERLYALAPPLTTQACLANAAGLNGELDASYRRLADALAQHKEADSDTRVWIGTMLAEMAVRLGQNEAAERHYRAALQLDPADSYLLGSYADFLLGQRRPAAVVAMLREKTRNDALLLRYALALQAAGASEAGAQVRALDDRFQAALMRHDSVHQREQARFELWLKNDSVVALALARSNWEVQREPADLRIYAEAAAASGDRDAARALLQWLREHRTEDSTLAPVLAKLEKLA